jgi:hypothetical protein
MAQREIRFAKGHIAADSIGSIEHGKDIHIFSLGYFSLIDVIVHILDQIGSADVVLSAWTAAHSHLELTHELLGASAIKSLRIVIDGSFMVRQPMYHKRMVELFGLKNIRSIKTHAKYVILTNDTWNIVIQTSMNMNENPRCENLIISEGKDLSDFMLNIVDKIFDEVDQEEEKQIHVRLNEIESYHSFSEIQTTKIKMLDLNIPETSCVI